MRIDSIEIFHLALPLVEPLPVTRGPGERLETVLLAMHSGGATGWGEASPGNAPCVGSEWAAGAFALLRDWLAPAIAGQSVSSGEELSKSLAGFRGNQFAKAALDTAWWDLQARMQDRPLHALLGVPGSACGREESAEAGTAIADAIEVGATFDQMDSIESLRAAIERAVAQGITRVKLKFRPGWDVRMVDFVRKEFPLLDLAVDCEGALNLGQTDMLYRLEDFSLETIEQPFPADDLVGHAMIQQSLRTSICLDESIATVAQAEMAIELQSCKQMNLKPGRVGGLTAAVAIHDLCHEACIPCYVGAMPQTTIGARHGLALASMPNCRRPADYLPHSELLADDVAEPLRPAKDNDGRLRVPLWSSPGIGVEPDRAKLEKFCIAKATLPI
ncbi:MAG: enolase C-terminal domain-like protein [Thermoguttaceae bacterium]